MKKQKKKNWTLPRHKVITALLRYPLSLYCRLMYGLRIPRKDQMIRQQSLILLNHQTPFDQFFVGMYCPKPVYYMATEDIFSNGWVSKLIKWLVAPIPIKKQTTDIKAVMNCIKVAKEGGNICIAPEGNRTYSGKTEYMFLRLRPWQKSWDCPSCCSVLKAAMARNLAGVMWFAGASWRLPSAASFLPRKPRL